MVLLGKSIIKLSVRHFNPNKLEYNLTFLIKGRDQVEYKKKNINNALETWNFDIVCKIKFLQHFINIIFFFRNFNILEVTRNFFKDLTPTVFVLLFCCLILNTPNDNEKEVPNRNGFLP